MLNQDASDIDKAIDEAYNTPKGLPEAPASTHIDSYYKGFHVGFTIRSNNNSEIPASKSKQVIESLILLGYKPSWNEETNGNHAPKPTSPICPVCSGEMVMRNSAKGKFWGCTKYPNCKGTRPMVDEYQAA